ncbi:SubName: Full=Uncharacterized protein {ECO:0000313/EMBL:CCA74384.1} [Serendipita indica DSM 11827]|uniref:Winged helix-turn helix domain-containing protein n=1 Tax=Serendipita indica (strain DSM 11827) TaxID=1109443 RepID=G4TSU9_SERID|nr:SubName: Full=Uncharacterized protein {ECO:0000313/EMBL:CCA74384.1} [Serendipita indica DSM 11827]CCA74384.1 hypothetical protein PIIN_08336 [Serendipita indica DSM 11827]
MPKNEAYGLGGRSLGGTTLEPVPRLLHSMPYRQISNDFKQRCLFLLDHTEIYDDVSSIPGVSKSSLKRWKKNYEKYGSVSPPRSVLSGKPRNLNAWDVEHLDELLTNNPDLLLEEVHEWLALLKDARISQSTIYRAIKDLGYSHKKLKLRAYGRDEEEIAAWKADFGRRSRTDQIIAIDGSIKDVRTLYRTTGGSVEVRMWFDRWMLPERTASHSFQQ